MDKNKERGILKLEPRSRDRSELTPQGSYERVPSSPQPSVDRLSVSWADPSMASTSVNLFHLPTETAVSNEVKFSPAGDGSEDEDYSSISAVLRQRRCSSLRHSRKGRRRTSSPFLPDERSRRRSSVFTTSSGETAISIDDQGTVTQEEIFKTIRMHKEVLASVKQQPLGLRRKLKLVHLAKRYIKCHEGQLQERLAQSKSTKDIYASFKILLAARWHQLKREAANTSNLLIPWELRIKEIESHFGSVVASYFTFLRWLFWVNLVIGFILLVFVIVPEYLTANTIDDGERKRITEEEKKNATNLLTLWEFEGFLRVSPIFYGYYSSIERSQYRMPLAYFLTGLVVYIYAFVAILRKMAENSRMSKLSEKEDECIFSWKLFTGWDFMIGNTETAQNRTASVILGFKEALLEEAEKKKDVRNWRIIARRVIVNISVLVLLSISVVAVLHVVSTPSKKPGSWLSENLTTIVVTIISIAFPVLFELLGFLEKYHPRTQLRLQLFRIMLLNLLNIFSLIFGLFYKIHGMSSALEQLKPNVTTNINSTTANTTSDMIGTLVITEAVCQTIQKACLPCDELCTIPTAASTIAVLAATITPKHLFQSLKGVSKNHLTSADRHTEQISDINNNDIYNTTPKSIIPAENLKLNVPSGTLSLLEQIEIISHDTERGVTEIEEDTDESNEDSEVNYYDEVTSSTEISVDQWTNIDNTNTIIDDISNYTYTSSSTEDFDIYKNVTINLNTMSTTIQDIFIEDISTTNQTQETTNVNEEITKWDGITSSMAETTINSREVSTLTSASDFSFSTNYEIGETEIIIKESESVSKIYPKITEVDTTPIMVTKEVTSPDQPNIQPIDATIYCPDYIFNCTTSCGEENVTQLIFMSKCNITKKCYIARWVPLNEISNETLKANMRNGSETDIVYFKYNIRMYNLTERTRSKLSKLCWETMLGQEMVKLTMMDLVFLLLSTLFMDFFRALFVRYMNRCWCWDLEKKFPQYGDFKIAENILHLINNQGQVWMAMFFSPGLVVLNVFKLVIMMYLRSWAVMTCNVPHEVVFRVSKSNNFYLLLLLTMLFLCVLPVGYSIVWVKPSWHCGPFSEYDKIYQILTTNLYNILPDSVNYAIKYIASPAIVIPLLVLLILIIYYLLSLTSSLREANNDLKIQLRRERTEERRKMFQLVDTRRRGQSAMDNTPFARWKKALPGLPLGKSIDSDDRKTITEEDSKLPQKPLKRKGNIFAKIVVQAVDKKSDISELERDASISPNNDDETDTDFHETLPREVLKAKDITIIRNDKKNVEFKNQTNEGDNLKVKVDKEDRTDKAAVEKRINETQKSRFFTTKVDEVDEKNEGKKTPVALLMKETENSSVIPVITISTTESDEEFHGKDKKLPDDSSKKHTDPKSLRRQSSVDSI